jgi:hypothetical protein
LLGAEVLRASSTAIVAAAFSMEMLNLVNDASTGQGHCRLNGCRLCLSERSMRQVGVPKREKALP